MPTAITDVVANERATRIERSRRVPVYRLTGPATELLPPGSGVFVIASEASDVFPALADALARQDVNAIAAAVTRQKEALTPRQIVSMEAALSAFVATATFADLSYGPKLLAIDVFPVDGVPFTRVFFTFVGGDFDDAQFQMTEYAHDDAAPRLQGLVAVHAPTLSERERVIVRRIPGESQSMLFAPADPAVMLTPAAAFVATITAGVLVATVGTALGRCHHIFEAEAAVDVSGLREEGTGLAVQQLLALRQQALAAPPKVT